jgi:RecB family exonuclease
LKSSRPQEERLLFLLALQAARERLILTVPRAEAASGTEKLPSSYLLAALECLAGRPISCADLNNHSGNAEAPRVVYVRSSCLLSRTTQTAIDLREFDLGRIKACLRSGHPEAGRYLERLSPNFARALEAEQAQWGTDALTVYDGVLVAPQSRQALAELFAEDRVYSATALERYASCPYRFFLNDVLRLRELDDPSSLDFIGARDKGDLMHAILSDFYTGMKAQKKLPLTAEDFEDYRAALAAVCQEHFQRVENDGLTGLAATWELNRKSILRDLERYLRSEIDSGADWIPEDFERGFGTDGGAPALEVPIGAGRIRLSGKVDRIDLEATRKTARVIDYKSGKRRHNLKVDLAGGRALQLPVYLLAAAKLYPHIDLRRSAAQYCHVTRAGNWSRCEFDGAALLTKQEDLREILDTILAGCRNGIFPRCPEGNSCGNCEYSSVGDPRRDALWQRKQSDPRLDAFRQMRSKE